VVERGRSRAYCRVVWIGEANSPLHGQVGIQCVEAEKTLWVAELRDMEQVYDPVTREVNLQRLGAVAGSGNNRRRYERFSTEGVAELLQKGPGAARLEGELKDVSEVGCLVSTNSLVLPGTDLKHAALDVGLGIEFREIRKGDRAVLQYLVRKLAADENAAEKKAQKPKTFAAQI